MNVGELIGKLQEYDKSLPVSVYSEADEGGDYADSITVQVEGDEETWLYYQADYPFGDDGWARTNHDQIVTIKG